MRSRKTLLYSLLAGSALSVVAISCADYLTGQVLEPDGPLLVTKLTLLDKTSRDVAVFTDTSLPDCKQFSAEYCAVEANRTSTECRICYNDVKKDAYSPTKSPPTPDSASDLRVVFNKIPLKWNGSAYSPDAAPEGAIRLECDGCRGIPSYKRQLDVSGSSLSYDPRDIPYGPSLKLSIDKSDPRASLEPDTSFRVYLDTGLADRNDNRVDWQAAASLLRFKTEPLRVLRMGRGDSTTDAWVYASSKYGDGSSGSPYSIADLPRDSAIVLRLNASTHPDPLTSLKLPAVVRRADGTTSSVDVLVGTNVWKRNSDGTCAQDSQRLVYFWPDTVDQRWPSGAVEVSFTLAAGSLKDLAQVAGFPVGKHALGSDISVRARILTTDAPSGYAGTTTGVAKKAGMACVQPSDMGSDLGTASDAGVADMGGDMTARDM